MDHNSNSRLQIIGVGQEWRGDDAAGLLVARYLKQLVEPQNCRGGPACPPPGGRTPGCAPTTNTLVILENSGSVSDLLVAWQESEAVILADAVRGGGRPGEIYRFPVHERPLPAELFPATSTHAWGVAQAVALSRVLGALPPYLVIYGIEGRDFGPGREVTPEVARAVPEAARQIRQEIEHYLSGQAK
jgi:hydrogenase maturation protease